MNALTSLFGSLPRPVQFGAVGVGAAGVAGGSTIAVLRPQLILPIVLGLVVLVVFVAVFLLVRTMIRRKKARAFEKGLAEETSKTPRSLKDGADIARLDQMRQSFEKGIEVFANAGKSLYDFPWYMIIGEPASGKSEAIRRSNIGFPPGLNDELQGSGGTINMDWWFTDDAVILDTAGRLTFGGEHADEAEWKDFLATLRKSRRECPVNGLIITLPVDRLIHDDLDTIDRKGARFASQINLLRKTLGVRFPVYVWVTKADRLPGFREFFSQLKGPEEQAQMLGWSNPASLDERFDPTKVSSFMDELCDRIRARRFALFTEDPQVIAPDARRRADAFDELYAFPEAVKSIAPRLEAYLERIFSGDRWSGEPPFLRGIYFTSAIQQDGVLDEDLADALGVSVDSLEEQREWTDTRAYFLKDVLKDKIFSESGLVTSEASTNASQARKRRVVIGAGAAAALLLAGLTAVGWYQWRHGFSTQERAWPVLAASVADSVENAEVVDERSGRRLAPDVHEWTIVHRVGDAWRPTPLFWGLADGDDGVIGVQRFLRPQREGGAALMREGETPPIPPAVAPERARIDDDPFRDAEGDRMETSLEAVVAAYRLAAGNLDVPLSFAFPALFKTGELGGGARGLYTRDRVAALRALLDETVVEPLLVAVSARLEQAATDPDAEPIDVEPADVLRAVGVMHALAEGRAPDGDETVAEPLDLDLLLRLVCDEAGRTELEGAAMALRIAELERIIGWTRMQCDELDGLAWPGDTLVATASALEAPATEHGLALVETTLRDRPALVLIERLPGDLEAYETAESELLASIEAAAPEDRLDAFRTRLEAVRTSGATLLATARLAHLPASGVARADRRDTWDMEDVPDWEADLETLWGRGTDDEGSALARVSAQLDELDTLAGVHDPKGRLESLRARLRTARAARVDEATQTLASRHLMPLPVAGEDDAWELTLERRLVLYESVEPVIAGLGSITSDRPAAIAAEVASLRARAGTLAESTGDERLADYAPRAVEDLRLRNAEVNAIVGAGLLAAVLDDPAGDVGERMWAFLRRVVGAPSDPAAFVRGESIETRPGTDELPNDGRRTRRDLLAASLGDVEESTLSDADRTVLDELAGRYDPRGAARLFADWAAARRYLGDETRTDRSAIDQRLEGYAKAWLDRWRGVGVGSAMHFAARPRGAGATDDWAALRSVLDSGGAVDALRGAVGAVEAIVTGGADATTPAAIAALESVPGFEDPRLRPLALVNDPRLLDLVDRWRRDGRTPLGLRRLLSVERASGPMTMPAGAAAVATIDDAVLQAAFAAPDADGRAGSFVAVLGDTVQSRLAAYAGMVAPDARIGWRDLDAVGFPLGRWAAERPVVSVDAFESLAASLEADGYGDPLTPTERGALESLDGGSRSVLWPEHGTALGAALEAATTLEAWLERAGRAPRIDVSFVDDELQISGYRIRQGERRIEFESLRARQEENALAVEVPGPPVHVEFIRRSGGSSELDRVATTDVPRVQGVRFHRQPGAVAERTWSALELLGLVGATRRPGGQPTEWNVRLPGFQPSNQTEQSLVVTLELPAALPAELARTWGLEATP